MVTMSRLLTQVINVNNLGNRIKTNYEHRARKMLTRRMPVIIRLDGKAFHTYTKGMAKPFCKPLMDIMDISAVNVMREIQGCKAAYVQSDEVSLLLTDYDKLETEPWFGYNQSKMESVAASMMTAFFNNLAETAFDFSPPLAFFDARAFNIPREEVVNYFLWRCKDWERNSTSMYCGHFYSHKEMHGQGKADQHEMLYQKGKNWTTDLSEREKNGCLIVNGTIQGQGTYNPQPTYESLNRLLQPTVYCDQG